MGQSRLLVSLSLLVIFVAVWTLYGAISAAPAAIHNDMAEAYVWGRQFELGYFQHPPFWAWVAGLWFEVFPPHRLGVRVAIGCQRRSRPMRRLDAYWRF